MKLRSFENAKEFSENLLPLKESDPLFFKWITYCAEQGAVPLAKEFCFSVENEGQALMGAVLLPQGVWILSAGKTLELQILGNWILDKDFPLSYLMGPKETSGILKRILEETGGMEWVLHRAYMFYHNEISNSAEPYESLFSLAGDGVLGPLLQGYIKNSLARRNSASETLVGCADMGNSKAIKWFKKKKFQEHSTWLCYARDGVEL